MRLLTIFLALTIVAIIQGTAVAQWTYTSEVGDYVLELPSEKWRLTRKPDSEHPHAELIYGERNNGYLRIRKELVEAETTASDLCRRDQEQKLRFQPGYVGGKEEKFAGRLNGVTSAYEYTSGGKQMAGRVYYLQADNRNIYVLHFTGLRDKLLQIRNQTDSIARSFRLNEREDQ